MAILNRELFIVDVVSDEVETDVDLFCPFTAQYLSIFLDKNHVFIVLVEDRIAGAVALR